VRDVHPTHYGADLSIETPEGPNIGLISSLSTYARINEFGFIETPYRKVQGGAVTDEIVFLTALEEEQFVIARPMPSSTRETASCAIAFSARKGGEYKMVSPEELNYMDVSPKQLVSVAAAMVPFLENDDANRALMGSNMQRQAVPLLQPEAPYVGTGMEHIVARDSGAVVLARRPGWSSTSRRTASWCAPRPAPRRRTRSRTYRWTSTNLTKYRRSNQNTCINQRPIVKKGDRVHAGDVIADGPAPTRESGAGTQRAGRLHALGRLQLRGRDPGLRAARQGRPHTSIHIEEFEVQAREHQAGQEEVTRDIPNVSEEALKDLDDSGIVRIGAKVKAGDILVGKITRRARRS